MAQTARDNQYVSALQPGFVLESYRILGVLGQGGFGITYLAESAKGLVAIKEYFPRHLVTRLSTADVKPASNADRDDFEWGLARFLDEAHTLAALDHPNLISVLRMFERYGTAYMVMRFEQGEDLALLMTRRAEPLVQSEVASVLFPILDALEVVHAAGFLHRDIKPANILIRNEGKPILLDFGAAKYDTSQHSQTLSVVATKGYAPFEQYAGDGRRQGPWTDLYGLSATMYRLITGITPPDSLNRFDEWAKERPDPWIPLAQLPEAARFSRGLVRAIDAGLAIRPEDRPQSVKQYRAVTKEASTAPPPTKRLDVPRIEWPTHNALLLVSVGLGALALLLLIALVVEIQYAGSLESKLYGKLSDAHAATDAFASVEPPSKAPASRTMVSLA